MISIATRLRPFTHTIGAKCIIPGTDAVLEAYPDCLHIGELKIPLSNPPFDPNFTLQQDLERNCVWVFGKKYRIKISAKEGGFEMVSSGETTFFPAKICLSLPSQIERLSLGSHKAQDWDMILRRFDMKEILPVLYLLGQKSPPLSEIGEISGTFEDFYRSSFHQMAVPRKSSLKTTFQKIRSFFIEEKENQIWLLPNNPFPEGRLLNIQMQAGSMDIEWTKKRLRRVCLRVCKTGEVVFQLPQEIKTYRVKEHLLDKGKIVKNGDPLPCNAGLTLYLDRFFA